MGRVSLPLTLALLVAAGAASFAQDAQGTTFRSRGGAVAVNLEETATSTNRLDDPGNRIFRDTSGLRV